MRNLGSDAAVEPSAAASMSITAVAEMLSWLWFCWGLRPPSVNVLAFGRFSTAIVSSYVSSVATRVMPATCSNRSRWNSMETNCSLRITPRWFSPSNPSMGSPTAVMDSFTKGNEPTSVGPPRRSSCRRCPEASQAERLSRSLVSPVGSEV